ncbi:ATP-binding protein [Nonomuraea sp. NPDC050663]|uniref:ATP-binding protein n=1 Tax=Nonomuraea sp. NPDC050663 TaxID=3364370 RepID=UPI0037B99C42
MPTRAQDPADGSATNTPLAGTLLRQWRERAMLTQEELAIRAGISARTIGRLENGALPRPSGTSLRRVAEALGLNDRERVTLAQAARGTRLLVEAEPLAVPSAHAWTPRQLPADVPFFVGRTGELAAIINPQEASSVPIITIDGMAGIGKSTLAVHAAHQLAPRFPDGQLFMNLHGHAQTMDRVDPQDALARILGTLGVQGEQIPRHIDDRIGLYRSLVADRRMLFVFDNAADEDQVRPLLPAGSGSRVLITSRRRLTDLDGSHTMSLDVLSTADALALFTHTAGRERVAGTSAELLTLTLEMCGHLPLVIRMTAARLRSHPAWNVAHLLERLSEQDPLTETEAEQPSLSTALELSYRYLTSDQRRTYRISGLHPGTDVTAETAAALLDTSSATARRLLDQLLEVHLTQEPAPGRYHMHDLVRNHAAQVAVREESESWRRAALTRLMDHYLRTVTAAMDALHPYEVEARPRPPASTPPNLFNPARAASWFEAECSNLLATVRRATDYGRPDFVLHISATLHRSLRAQGRYYDAELLLRQALTVARTTKNRPEELNSLLGLGEVRRGQGQLQQAFDYFGEALEIARVIEQAVGELVALTGLGHICRRWCRFEDALEYFEHALQIARHVDHRSGEMDALIGLGWTYRIQGHDTRSCEVFTEALALARVLGHRAGELQALGGIGHILRLQQDYEGALRHFTEALGLACAIGHRSSELDIMITLCEIHRLLGRHDQAAHGYRRALKLAREIGNPNWQFEALQGIGRLSTTLHDPKDALIRHQEALYLAINLGQLDDQARALDGLAYACYALHHYDEAAQYWQQALDILTSLKIDQTDDDEASTTTIRARLTQLSKHQRP